MGGIVLQAEGIGLQAAWPRVVAGRLRGSCRAVAGGLQGPGWLQGLQVFDDLERVSLVEADGAAEREHGGHNNSLEDVR